MFYVLEGSNRVEMLFWKMSLLDASQVNVKIKLLARILHCVRGDVQSHHLPTPAPGSLQQTASRTPDIQKASGRSDFLKVCDVFVETAKQAFTVGHIIPCARPIPFLVSIIIFIVKVQ